MSLRRYLSGFHPPVDDSVLTDASSWIADELFWPAFLLSVGGSKTAAVAFEADPADVEAYAEELHHTDSWPFIVLRLASGHRLYVLFRNFEEDAGWDYLLQPAGTDAVITLAALEGHFRGPAYSWGDLVLLANQPDPTRSAAERLLLLLPAMGDADLPADAGQVIAAAFVAVGGRQQYQREVSRELLEASRRFWGARGPATPSDRMALMAEAFSSGI
ncbi:hypothetical protein HH310_05755 [Actinoplanes sp. TBRC 11911]|uniref:hypothetical protein n=1 Tax=Actinoplanes sp. TBRC 11911 TaxID=2729386 RepID=UPI00145E4E97|nr:hypothetical protein [Actinoplanes sp. TBRC 11911]NMO50699.1 hypothetical protein [Actinoplanes sp. TBRC 11911]